MKRPKRATSVFCLRGAADRIDHHVLNQRNLTPDQTSLVRGRIYNRAKKAIPNPQGIGGRSGKIVKDQNDPQQTTAERIAKEHGVSAPTIKRDGKAATQPDVGPGASTAASSDGRGGGRQKATCLPRQRPVILTAAERFFQHGMTIPVAPLW